jgi:hypothetical protein
MTNKGQSLKIFLADGIANVLKNEGKIFPRLVLGNDHCNA